MNLTTRSHTKEALDDLSLSGPILKNTLNSLQFINAAFGNRRQLTNAVLRCCNHFPNEKTIRIVDLGCGGGDLIAYISNKLEKKGIKATFLGIDGNPETIRIAHSRARIDNNKVFEVADILDSGFSVPECEIIISSHFIYHFEDDHLIRFLNKMQKQAVAFIIFSELYRSKTAYRLFAIAKNVLPISAMAKKDGLIAIKRAHTLCELHTILQKSRFDRYTIEKKPWFRSLTKIYHRC